ncbi:hypothetical protein [Cupriavidus consociatus]|uniref:hypothetical protein n=1 Tax=Cupriavidus consociatus TaxID=2821357 RepID=UPI001AE30285|nr:MULTISPECIES: hypothetical protein [unclassified Cupriavidus]MBP0618383.1 hypothetical protein [Cupriavidus sp. LEh25]MDK2655018.1 hypothetical protein [Cupriavidus sp. LEh21]
MDGMFYTAEDRARERRDAMIEREITPVDDRIRRLREEIRAQIRHMRAVKARQFPMEQPTWFLILMCRTLAVERQYRKALHARISAYELAANYSQTLDWRVLEDSNL